MLQGQLPIHCLLNIQKDKLYVEAQNVEHTKLIITRKADPGDPGVIAAWGYNSGNMKYKVFMVRLKCWTVDV